MWINSKYNIAFILYIAGILQEIVRRAFLCVTLNEPGQTENAKKI
jgi:hypothetical protein